MGKSLVVCRFDIEVHTKAHIYMHMHYSHVYLANNILKDAYADGFEFLQCLVNIRLSIKFIICLDLVRSIFQKVPPPSPIADLYFFWAGGGVGDLDVK